MSEREDQDRLACLESLTDSDVNRMIPTRVSRGLPPGGRLGRR